MRYDNRGIASAIASMILMTGGLVLAPTAHAAWGDDSPCKFNIAVPDSAYNFEAPMKKAHRTKARTCGEWAKKNNAAVWVSFGPYSSSTYSYADRVFRAILRGGAQTMRFIEEDTRACPTTNVVCVVPMRAGIG